MFYTLSFTFPFEFNLIHCSRFITRNFCLYADPFIQHWVLAYKDVFARSTLYTFSHNLCCMQTFCVDPHTEQSTNLV